MANVTISLPDSLREFVDHQVAERGFENVSDYFNDLLRDAQENESDKRLEQLLLEGLNTGVDIPLDESFWKRLRAEAADAAGSQSGGDPSKIAYHGVAGAVAGAATIVAARSDPARRPPK